MFCTVPYHDHNYTSLGYCIYIFNFSNVKGSCNFSKPKNMYKNNGMKQHFYLKEGVVQFDEHPVLSKEGVVQFNEHPVFT